MTALRYVPLAPFPLAAPRRRAWPWLTTLLFLIAFFVAVHDPLSSQKWQKTVKGDVTKLTRQEAGGQLSRELGFLMVGAVGLALLARRGDRPLSPNLFVLFPVSMLLLWALLSAAWSADLQITLRRQAVLMCMVLAVLGLVRHFEVNRLVEMAFVHAVVIVAIGIAADLAFAPRGNTGEDYRFAGTLHPNHAGINASLLLLCSLFLTRHREDRRFLLVAAAAVVVVLLSRSRTALIGAVVGSMVFVLLAWPRRQRLLIALGGALAVGIVLAMTFAGMIPHLLETLLLNRKTSDPMTLTGRTMIWEFAIHHLRDDWGRILAGFGYGGFWTSGMVEALSKRAHFTLAEGHNAYLDITLQLGLVGLLLYLWGLLGAISTFIVGIRRFSSLQAAFCIALLAFTLVHHAAESAMTAPTFPTLLLWAVVGSAALRLPFGCRPGDSV